MVTCVGSLFGSAFGDERQRRLHAGHNDVTMPTMHTIVVPAGPPTGTVLKNGIEQQAQIVDRRPGSVYVHYVNQDKRMDEWVNEEHFMPSVTDSHSRKRRRSQDGSEEGSPAPSPPEEPTTVEMTEEDYDMEHHKKITAQRNFEKVHFGEWMIRTWYFSPYPLMENEEAEAALLNGHSNGNGGNTSAASPAPKVPGRHPTIRSHARVLDLLAGGLTRAEKTTLYVCQFCFKYMTDPGLYEAHRQRCTHTHPPGQRVYQRGAHSIWEVDGAVQKLYCQNLALFGKLFIDVKTLFFDCDNFLFYVLTEDAKGDRFRGFFSKEKVSYDDYNLACIITLPPFQRQGLGMSMIEFSYELCRRAGKVGTPERPLSDLGLRSYLAYWVATLIRFFRRVLCVLPPGSVKVTSKGNLPDLRSPSREPEDDGTPGLVNGYGAPSATSSNGAPKRKKRKGWQGQGEFRDLSFLNASPPEDAAFLDAFRTYEMKPNENGSAIVDVVVRCTLRDIARATNLRVEDAAFALNEIGLLMVRFASEDATVLEQADPSLAEDAKKFVYISREMVERVAKERDVKEPSIRAEFFLAHTS
ncbi:acyl-CoA N-acyltransferase [Roridomyces roridus]|uniref:histone acetyltransferase n=1 Tax=Roridomyces roridus TaxID=1738132 RepID=A0AAD7FFH6_9AGAR|nr:acyl-CoA N-acyltransferase [Roridomyces roridus]